METKAYFTITDEERDLIEKIKATQAPVLGKMTLTAVLRFALRFTAKRVKA